MRTFIVTICCVAILATAPWADAGETDPEKTGPIIVGVLENANFAFAAMMKRSFDMAVQAVNDRGGIDGRQIKLAYANDGGDKKMGIKAVQKLVKKDKAVMLVGGYSSSNTLFMAQAAERLNVPFLVCTAADDRITQRKKKNIFRLNPPASAYTRGLEDLLLQKIQPASLAIVYENSPYGTGGAMRMMWFCRENDIEITAIVPYHRDRSSAAYFKRLIAPLKNNPPEIVYMVSYMKDAVDLVKQIRASKIDALLCGGAGGFTHPDFLQQTGAAAQNLFTATLWTPDQQHPLARGYAENYRERFAQLPDYHGAEAYSALMVAADALGRSASLSPGDIRTALAETDLDTAFGRVTFAAFGPYARQNRQITLVLQALERQYRCVWPQAVAVTQWVVPAR